MTPDKEEKEVYYNVNVPALPEIVTFGTSVEEARYMAQDAIELVVLSRLEEGEEIPPDKKPAKIAKNAKDEEVIVAVSHQVEASPAKYVKTALFQSA